MSGPGSLQGFPQNTAAVTDPKTGNWTITGLRWAISMWQRTGTAQGGTSAPTGSILAFGGPVSAIPAGWLLCDGSAISRVGYAALFSVIQTYWGTGDGSDTFNLPPFTDRFLVGSGMLPFASRAGSIPLTGGSGNGYAAVNWIIKQ